MIREVAAIFLDALLGSRCVICRERSHNLSAHVFWEHADDGAKR